MGTPISVLSSMATRGLLAELAAAWDGAITLEATGGVDAASRVRAGERVDAVLLASAAMNRLEAEGFLLPGSLVGVACSAVAVAVRDGDTVPNISDLEAVKRTLLSTGRIGYSTGPSGDHLLALLERWGVRGVLGERLVQAPPGVPVGRLLAESSVDLAVQQRSELLDLPGIIVAGTLPPEIALKTVFTAAIMRTSARPDATRRFIAFAVSPSVSELKRQHGMEPV